MKFYTTFLCIYATFISCMIQLKSKFVFILEAILILGKKEMHFLEIQDLISRGLESIVFVLAKIPFQVLG